MDEQRFLRQQAQQFKSGIQRVQERRRAWLPFRNRALTRFGKLADEAKNAKLFENLYPDSFPNDEPPQQMSGVTLLWGKHRTGITDFSQSGKTSLDVEGGCALHYGQGPDGEVACVLYPFFSKTRMPLRKYYVFWIYSSPDRITERQLNCGIRLMFVLAHYSSFAGFPNWADWFCYVFLRVMTRLVTIWHADWVDAIFKALQQFVQKKIGSLASGGEGHSAAGESAKPELAT
jgi:hypothetical protein